MLNHEPMCARCICNTCIHDNAYTNDGCNDPCCYKHHLSCNDGETLRNACPDYEPECHEVQTKAYYRHFKGNTYYLDDIAKHTETGELLAIYHACYGDRQTYARPLNMFASRVDTEKYPDVKQKWRMERID